jgi:DNA-binding response OmpR family regulator
MNILLVEDERQLADVIARNLRAHGHEVAVAGSAGEAASELAATAADVVVLDINLPDLTGWDVLRGMDRTQRDRCRVVVISAGPISPQRIEELRPDRHLEKPFPMDALVRILGELAPNRDGPSGPSGSGQVADSSAGPADQNEAG